MSEPDVLHENMCNLSGPGVSASEIDKGIIARSLPPILQYACCYWVGHLTHSKQAIIDGDTTHVFLTNHLLHWIEAMSLIGKAYACYRSIQDLEAIVDVRSSQGNFFSSQLTYIHYSHIRLTC